MEKIIGPETYARINDAELRIIHLISGLDVGGAEMTLAKLLESSTKTWSSSVISLSHEGALAQRIRSNGVPVHSLSVGRWGRRASRLRQILSLVKRNRPQIIQGWLAHGNLAAALAGIASRNRIPIVWNVRQSLYNIRAERLGTAGAIRAGVIFSRMAHRIVYASKVSAEHHERLGYPAKKRVIIANGFDCGIFRPNERARQNILAELCIPDATVLIGLVARLDPMKDHATFLRAAGEVSRKHSSAHFLLVGKGISPQQPELLRLIDEQQLNGRISMLGERSDIADLTAALDIACSSSWSESFSNSIGEAMACAVPCIATDVGESKYLIGDTGIVVPPRSPLAMANALSELITIDPAARKRLGQLGRLRVIDQFSLSDSARRYDELYRDAVRSAT